MSEQLGYNHFERLTQDIFDRKLLVEACQRFLQLDITEEARLYAKAKLAHNSLILDGKSPTESQNEYDALIALARQNSNSPLVAIGTTKGACSTESSPISAIAEQRARAFSEALGIAIGMPLHDLPSAVSAARTFEIKGDDTILDAFVASGVGLANELSTRNLDDGYELFSHINELCPNIMYPHLFSLYNRMSKFIATGDDEALEQARSLIRTVREFSRRQSTATFGVHADFEIDITDRKKVVLGQFVDEIDDIIQRTSTDRSSMIGALTPALARTGKSAAEDGFLYSMGELYVDQYIAPTEGRNPSP